MEKRKLGRGEVGAVGLGAMSFAGVYGPTTEERSHATLAAMLDLGMTHVDTSNIYGMGVSEKIIGTLPCEAGQGPGPPVSHRHQGRDPRRPRRGPALDRQLARAPDRRSSRAA